MSDQPVTGVQRAGGDVSEAQREQVAMQPGALTERDNDTWQFTGDGKIPPSTVAGRVMELAFQGQAELQKAATDPNVQAAIAQHNVDHPANKALKDKGLSAQTPIPEGEPYTMQGGDSLKTMVQTIMRNPDFMQQLVQGASQGQVTVGGGAGKAEKATIGMVPTQARTLPLDR